MGGIKQIRFWFFLGVALWFLWPLNIPAQDIEDIEFDLYIQNNHVTVWLNLSRLLNDKNIQNLEDGIDLAVEYELILKSPKRFWGSNTITEIKNTFKLAYQVVTDEFILQKLPEDENTPGHKFISLSRLRQFLNDSMIINIAQYDSLKEDRSYFLELKITTISLTLINLASSDNKSENGGSPIKSLFNSFLDLTNYGREEIKVKSRNFVLDELYRVP